jgi:pectinesterase
VWPIEPRDYSRHITYNDNAMLHVMQIMRDMSYGNALFNFVPSDMVARATAALNKGLGCILATQIVVDGKKTGWCAQHDEITLLPANARAYELASESGKEGAQLLGFLMTLDLGRPAVPVQGVVDAVEGAVLFYDSVKILGTHYVQGTNDAGVSDSWIEEAPNAAPIWARFYDLEPPYRPFFCGRDGVKKYALSEIEVERRGGYAWYVSDPLSILNTAYPGWIAKWAIGRNVLAGASPPDGGSVVIDGGAADDAAAADEAGP